MKPSHADRQPVADLPPDRFESIRAQSGLSQSQVVLLTTGLREGDPLADEVVAYFEEVGWQSGMALFDRLLKEGRGNISSVPAPLAALFDQVEVVPSWVDPARLLRGGQAYMSVGILWLIFGLGSGAIVRTYLNPAIARVLVSTGNLLRMTEVRLRETSQWVTQAAAPSGLERYAPGFAATLKVRIVHAKVRHLIRKTGNWDEDRLGLPLNGLDMTLVGLTFSCVMLRSLAQVGIRFTRQEEADIYHLWCYIYYLMGIESKFWVETPGQAEALLSLIESVNPPPDANSRLLSGAYLGTQANTLVEMGWRRGLAEQTGYTFLRLFHGQKNAEALGVPFSPFVALQPLLAGFNLTRRSLLRLKPGRLTQMGEQNASEDLASTAPLAGQPQLFERPDLVQLAESEAGSAPIPDELGS